MVEITRAESSKAPKYTQHEAAPGVRIAPGPFIGIVYNNVDPMRSGRLQVYIPELGGDPSKESSLRTVAYASPFFGTTPPKQDPETGLFLSRDGQNFETNPHSYGMWMVPPDLGQKVLCIFVNGDPFKGYWFACVPDWPNMHMVPAIARPAQGDSKDPVVEYNQDVPNAVGNIENFYKNAKTAHDKLKEQYQKQGLSQDEDRGPITSSAFRETPSAVFGISTPGRKLKEEGNKDGGAVDKSGKGRKGGHSIVMDDGDEKGNSQLMRFRTAGGHQLMMNDSAGFIYITNQAGTAWIDMDDAGNINIWCKGQFNVKADGPIQLESGASVKIKAKSTVDILADATANLTGKGGINLSSPKLTKVEGKDGLHLKGKNTYLTGDDCVQINGGKHMDMSAGCITINSKSATKAQGAQTANGPSGMPTKEPWSGHKKKSGGSGTSVAGAGSSSSSTFAKAADYTNGVDLTGGTISQTGGQGPGPTGFRQGTESAPSSYATYTGTATGTVKDLIETFKIRESGGNYNAQASTSSASGAYQFINSTWQTTAARHGIGTEYKRAGDAPPAVQDAVMTAEMTRLYNLYNGDVRKITNTWFTGNPEGNMGAKAQAANPGLNADIYYAKFAGTLSQVQAKNAKAAATTAATTVKPGDSNPDVGVGTNVAAGDSSPNPDVINTTANDTKTVGWVPPNQEQQYRDQLRAENKAGADYGAPVIKSDDLATRQADRTQASQFFSTRANEAEARIAQNTEKLGALENDRQAGFISEEQYRADRLVLESNIMADTNIVTFTRTQVDTINQNIMESNRASGLSNLNKDEYAARQEYNEGNTFGDSPIADNTAANYQTPTYDANGTFTGYVEETTYTRDIDWSGEAAGNNFGYQTPTGEEVTAQIASEANMNDFNNMQVDSVDPWSVAPNIVQDQAISNAYDDYGNPLGGSPETGASSGGGIGYSTGSDTYGPAAPPSASDSGRELGPGSNDPVVGPTPAPGSGGTGTPGAPSNAAPQSPAKPAC